ncbi:MAG: aminotransferase class IV, partial [Candidatus Nanopelagicales bacterium]|nr:aminotransferase class IV [Candidatus Nanopelagicales bacterium]
MGQRWVWLNGTLTDANRAMVNVADRGFLAGDGVFEAIKVVEGKAFAVTRHLARLRRSTEVTGLPTPDEAEIRNAIAETVAANTAEHGGSARVRVTLTAGVGSGIHRIAGNSTLLVTVEPLPPMAAAAKVGRSPWPRNDRSATAGAKTTSYAENAVILAHARRSGFDEAILSDTRGRLSEGTTCNVLVAHEG